MREEWSGEEEPEADGPWFFGVCYSNILKRCWEFPNKKVGFYCSLITLLLDKGSGLASQTVSQPHRMWGVETW